MFAVIAAVLFGIALLLVLAGRNLGVLLDPDTLTIGGLLCVALHLSGVGPGPGRRWGRRR